jgi:hypothetical protein
METRTPQQLKLNLSGCEEAHLSRNEDGCFSSRFGMPDCCGCIYTSTSGQRKRENGEIRHEETFSFFQRQKSAA